MGRLGGGGGGGKGYIGPLCPPPPLPTPMQIEIRNVSRLCCLTKVYILGHQICREYQGLTDISTDILVCCKTQNTPVIRDRRVSFYKIIK